MTDRGRIGAQTVSNKKYQSDVEQMIELVVSYS